MLNSKEIQSKVDELPVIEKKESVDLNDLIRESLIKTANLENKFNREVDWLLEKISGK